MTREEAIRLLNGLMFKGKLKEALDMAIKALEQEPTTKNDLGVDREDAVERLNALKQFIGYDKDSEIVKATQKSLDMAISALEHPERNVVSVVPCGDAISRSDVLKLMQDNWHTHNGDWAMQESIDDIRVLPSVTPQEPRWIPVSEKLPEPFTFVNATCRSLVDDRENWVVETIYLPIPKEANKHGYSDWGNIPILNWGEAEVIAWVERIIPQPYKAEIDPQESEE